MYLGQFTRNCIYADGSVISIEAGPCAPAFNGADLIDVNDSGTWVDVIEPAPPAFSGAMLAVAGLALLALFGKGR